MKTVPRGFKSSAVPCESLGYSRDDLQRRFWLWDFFGGLKAFRSFQQFGRGQVRTFRMLEFHLVSYEIQDVQSLTPFPSRASEPLS